MTRKSALPLGLLLAALGAASVAWLAFASGTSFPHEKHDGVFEDCSDCHGGMAGTNRADYYTVTRELCTDCHEADIVDAVPWDELRNRRGNLKFQHLQHAGLECADCHQAEGRTNAMAVIRPKPERCLDCHVAPAHLSTQSECVSCHKPLTEAEWTAERIAAFPQPDSHAEPGFLREHGDMAAEDIAECAICHTRDACQDCHLQVEGAAVIRELGFDDRVSGMLLLEEPAGFHPPGWILGHRTAAGSDNPRCESCHAPEACADCHDAPVTPGFHGVNYLMRHAAEAYARDTNCASCHSTEVFCRDCHSGVGIAGADAMTGSYHDAQPLWAIGHGRAARQSMDNCASCHQQTDCIECHSARTGLGINPHGSGFNAERMADKAPHTCLNCHAFVPKVD